MAEEPEEGAQQISKGKDKLKSNVKKRDVSAESYVNDGNRILVGKIEPRDNSGDTVHKNEVEECSC